MLYVEIEEGPGIQFFHWIREKTKSQEVQWLSQDMFNLEEARIWRVQILNKPDNFRILVVKDYYKIRENIENGGTKKQIIGGY